jgi:hypothetical protein
MALHDLVEDFKEMVERCRLQHTMYNVRPDMEHTACNV